MTSEGLVNAGGRSKFAFFTDGGETKPMELLASVGAALEQYPGEAAAEKASDSGASKQPVFIRHHRGAWADC